MDSRHSTRPKKYLGWFIQRLVLPILTIVWFTTMVLMFNSVPTSPVGPRNTQPHSARLCLPGLVNGKDECNKNNTKKAEEEQEGKAEEHNEELTDYTQEQQEILQGNKQQKPVASIFELSLFGNKSPTDFQLYTPHAPTCSEPLDAKSVSYTLVSQLSDDRLWMVHHHCARWGDNPMSIAVFTDKPFKAVRLQLVSQGCSAEHLTIQTVSKSRYDPIGTEYPVNLLRNLALSAVKTSHIIYADVDFWPASDLHSILSDQTNKERLASDSKLAIVIPVFQMFRRCKGNRDCRGLNIRVMPKDKQELNLLRRKRAARIFDPTNVGGHSSTDYNMWNDQATGTLVDLPCIKSNRYEPYLTVRFCRDLPPFQEGFTGYGKNKITWVMQLRRAGYLFSQLGGAFLVHYPHLDSKSRLEWNKKPDALIKNPKFDQNIDWGSFKRARVDALFLVFKKWLDQTIEEEPRVLMCDDAADDDVSLWVHPDKGNRRHRKA